jgi:hypothetical protein
MRARLSGALVAAAALASPAPALADPMPSGSLGFVTGIIAGTGADASRLGVGWLMYGGHAAWQPISTDRSYGYTIRWSTMLGRLYGADAAEIDDSLSTVQMDLTVGMRYRPWATPRRYLTARVGAELLRANEPIQISDDPDAEMRRAFVGGIASVGFDQYIYNFLLSVDVRYGLIGDGPSQLALLVGFGVTGP